MGVAGDSRRAISGLRVEFWLPQKSAALDSRIVCVPKPVLFQFQLFCEGSMYPLKKGVIYRICGCSLHRHAEDAMLRVSILDGGIQDLGVLWPPSKTSRTHL